MPYVKYFYMKALCHPQPRKARPFDFETLLQQPVIALKWQDMPFQGTLS